jgi:hypothetical protein
MVCWESFLATPIWDPNEDFPLPALVSVFMSLWWLVGKYLDEMELLMGKSSNSMAYFPPNHV